MTRQERAGGNGVLQSHGYKVSSDSRFQVTASVPLEMRCGWFGNQPYSVKLRKEKTLRTVSEFNVTDFQNKLLTVETVLCDTAAKVG